MRRGVDVLLARKDVDPKRLAYVGHSYNAVVGAILSGVERRFKAFVLMAATMSDEVSMKFPEYQQYRTEIGPEKFDAYNVKYSWTDQGKYVSHAAPAIVFLQYGSQEKFLTPERARLYAAVVSEPKRFELYDAPHALNAAARRERIAFLTEQLKLKALPAATIASIPDLFQPATQNQPALFSQTIWSALTLQPPQPGCPAWDPGSALWSAATLVAALQRVESARCRLGDRLRKRDRQTIRIECHCQFDPFTFSLRRRHYEANAFRFQFFVRLVNVLDIEPDRATARLL
jgi:hypothetical protein